MVLSLAATIAGAAEPDRRVNLRPIELSDARWHALIAAGELHTIDRAIAHGGGRPKSDEQITALDVSFTPIMTAELKDLATLNSTVRFYRRI
jgi:hypothetical protein